MKLALPVSAKFWIVVAVSSRSCIRVHSFESLCMVLGGVAAWSGMAGIFDTALFGAVFACQFFISSFVFFFIHNFHLGQKVVVEQLFTLHVVYILYFFQFFIFLRLPFRGQFHAHMLVLLVSLFAFKCSRW